MVILLKLKMIDFLILWKINYFSHHHLWIT